LFKGMALLPENSKLLEIISRPVISYRTFHRSLSCFVLKRWLWLLQPCWKKATWGWAGYTHSARRHRRPAMCIPGQLPESSDGEGWVARAAWVRYRLQSVLRA
jgi:hypothetical protein